MRPHEVAQRLRRRRQSLTLTLSTFATISVLWIAPPARASLFGEENASLLAILGEMIEQVIQATKTVEGVFQTVTHLRAVVTQTAKVLEKLGTADGQKALLQGDLSNLENLLYLTLDTTTSVQGIDKNIQRLGFRLNSIDSQHRSVFPDRGALGAMPTRDFPKTARIWNDVLRESSSIAMRTQTSIESLQSRMETQRTILNASSSADGVVAQLQTLVSGLALLHSDLASVETNLAVGQRVTAAWAGEHAARLDLSDEENKRMLEGFSRPSSPRHKLTRLP